MSGEASSKAVRRAPKWVHYFVDYAGLVVFLITLVVTKSAVTASWAIVGGSILALAIGLVFERRVAPMPLVTAVLGLIFGGLTLFFHDERFIKVKPTILYTAFGLFLITGALRGKNPLKVLMGDAFHLPDPVVRTLTLRYALMFFALALANEVVWRTQSTVFWGFFKFPGVPILIFLFAMSQAPLMMKHMPDEDAEEAKPPADAP
ncbi:MAG TPA: inner membrane-spanning protein YciB [Phenylobacterium sp.]|jgi:intracellular septation protein|uniref:inner membrane-spanning protein YciB n=1 Tax=Phenylobacterium sp. TaxID=1871053 RepID=UPI002C84762F|nr:inner membrane-spanning protein YciB [Phenylobacterium sp.]HXA40866.1 inner membrane-spanning protein YciB [Phenylobacterium sp.]